MSATAAAMTKQERGPKTRGTEWWYPPPDTPLNLAIPYVVSIVADGLSLAQSRVLTCVTDTSAGAKRQERIVDERGRETQRRGFVCNPGGYTRIAQATGLCRKTVYNAVKALIKKGVLEPWKVVMKGRQRVKTIYFALHYGDILPAWRANKDWFHTAHNSSIVVRKRSKRPMTVEEAAEWRIDPARAPKRGCGRGLSEFAELRTVTPTPVPEGVTAIPATGIETDPDLESVYAELSRDTVCCVADAIKLVELARSEADKMGYSEAGYGGPFPALTVAELVVRIRAVYKSTPRFPSPTVGWYLSKMPAEVANWLRHDWEQASDAVLGA